MGQQLPRGSSKIMGLCIAVIHYYTSSRLAQYTATNHNHGQVVDGRFALDAPSARWTNYQERRSILEKNTVLVRTTGCAKRRRWKREKYSSNAV